MEMREEKEKESRLEKKAQKFNSIWRWSHSFGPTGSLRQFLIEGIHEITKME